MHRQSWSFHRSGAAAVALVAALAACGSDNNPTAPRLSSTFTDARLVADLSSAGATTVDANLTNPWGLAFSPTGILWVSNNASGTSTLYDALGAARPLIVNVPTVSSGVGGRPTGIIFNATADFLIPGGAKSSFVFAGEDGVISAWNGASGTQAVKVADRSTNGAVYKGLATGTNTGANFLYATDFKNARVDVFDANFAYVKSFTDATIPAGYAPFGIQNVGGQLFVTYAKQLAPDNEDDQAGAGLGYVDVFNSDGTLSKRFASQGRLNAPWGIAVAPATFGSASGDILIGNFGDGRIGAYDPSTGAFRGFLRGANDADLVIDGLWALTFGVTTTSTSTLFYSAGPSGETHGLIGTLTAN